jgi:hypothetical protein
LNAHEVCRRTARVFTLGAVALVLVACAGIQPKRMVPEATAGPERKIAQRMRVMPVSGTRDTFFGGAAFPSKEQFHEAVVATLEKSGIFAGVSPSAGDVDLSVSVLSIDQQGFIPYTVRLVANYKFTARDGSLLWSETYDSSFSANDFAGASRTVKANEGAVRENLKAFVQGVRERFRP